LYGFYQTVLPFDNVNNKPFTDIEQVLREKKPFILRCMLDGIKKRQGGLSNGPDSR
jgi:hypothetical protein